MSNNVDLTSFNTFAIHVSAYRIVTAHTERELLMFWQQSIKENRPVLLMGEGGNIVFLENYNGTVLLNRIKGISIKEDNHSWYLHIGSGEVWHNLVTYSLSINIPGLENLALIPGYVGAAPIQNIGAYGVEFNQLCDYVDVLKLTNGKKIRFSVSECKFSYRNSIFKHYLNSDYAIVAVGLKLSKYWTPVLDYGDLTQFSIQHKITPYQIFNMVCSVRRQKLPDPAIIGNAGSFFKNPVIEKNIANKLLNRYPNIPHYFQSDGMVKLAAGWLIDSCQLKGHQFGGAAVYDKQALVLINYNQRATGKDIISLASYVRKHVVNKFNIWLEP